MNNVTQTMHKTYLIKSRFSSRFLYSMQQKAGEEPGNEARVWQAVT